MQSIYNIPLKSWDGNENMLEQYKGKVTLIINVTTECGNAPEYRIIEKIYRKYKDKGFEVVAIPTNEYCGEGIVYDDFQEGISCADDAKSYAAEEHDVTYNFAELSYSNPQKAAGPEIMDKYYPNRNQEFPKQLPEDKSPHLIYQTLSSIIKNKQGKYKCTCSILEKEKENGFCVHGEYMGGNFEKYLIDKDGQFVAHYHNGSLIPRIGENDYAQQFYSGGTQEEFVQSMYFKDDSSHSNLYYKKKIKGEEEYNRLCSDIENIL
jgi:glutathione peroxidase-family protein